MKSFPALGIILMTALCGCAGSGSGGSGGSQTLRVAVNLAWGGKTGTFSAPASAQSAVIWFSHQDPIAPFPKVTINKSATLSAYTQTLEVPATEPPGILCNLYVAYYSQPGGQGMEIGQSSAGGRITNQGIFIGLDSQPLGQVGTMLAQPAPVIQHAFTSVNVGTTTDLQFWMEDQFGQVYSKNPTGGVWSLQPANNVPPTNLATLTPSGALTGVAPGLIGITVSYQGITSQTVYVGVAGT